jgi:hypothetical protein
MGQNDYSRISQEIWTTMAPGWECWRTLLADAVTPVREWLIRQLALRPGAVHRNGPVGGEALAIAAVAVAPAAANGAAVMPGTPRSVRRRCLSCDRPTAATLQPDVANPGSRSFPAALDGCDNARVGR